MKMVLLLFFFFLMTASAANAAEKGKILVAYFSWSGNTRAIAEQIHQAVGGDLFEIKTVNPYPEEYHPTTEAAKQEQESNARPVLAVQVNDMDSYDVVFVGYPIWWGTLPMTLFTFLEQYDFSGKTIIPFCTHEGSALGRSIADIKKLCPRSTVREGLAIRGRNAGNAQSDIAAWLKKIGQ
jgi:flavodoxin